MSTTENGIQFVYAAAGDDIKKLAKKLDMMEWQFRKYNDMGKKHIFKKVKSYTFSLRGIGEPDWHTVRKGETLWSISQKYGIKLKSLREEEQPRKGHSPQNWNETQPKVEA